MKLIKHLIEAVKAEFEYRAQRRNARNRAGAVALRMAMNGCRL